MIVKNLRIRSKLLLVFGTLISALLVMATVSIVSQHTLNGLAETLGKDRRDKLVAVDGLGRAASDYRNAEANSILSLTVADRTVAGSEASVQVGAVNRDLEFLDRVLKNAKARSVFAGFRRDWVAYLNRSKNTLALARNNQSEAALANFRRSRTLFDRVNQDAANLKSVQIGLMDGDLAAANATYTSSRNMAIGLAIAVIA